MPDKVIGTTTLPSVAPSDKVIGTVSSDFFNTEGQLKQNDLDFQKNTKREAISAGENFMNRMSLSKDMIDKSLYEGLKIQKDNNSGLGSFLSDEFLKERTDKQDQDINIAVNGINWKEADLKPFRFADLLANPIDYAANELPKQLGMAAGMLDTTLGLAGAGFGAGFAVGSAAPVVGNVVGAGAGAIGGFTAGMLSLFGGKYLEGISESTEVYKDAIKILKKNSPHLSDEEIQAKAFEQADGVIAKNMALTLMDIPEFALSFMPVGSILGKGGALGRAATRFALRNPIKTGVFRVGATASLEGAEEGIQYLINESALNNLRNKNEKSDLSLSGYWNNEEWKSSVETGMLMGGLAGGMGQIISRTFNSAKYLHELNNGQAINEQKKLRNDFILKQAMAGRTDEIMVAIEKEGEKSHGIFSDASITDSKERVNASKKLARAAYDDMNEKADVADILVNKKGIKDKQNLELAYENRLDFLDLKDKIKLEKERGTMTEEVVLREEEKLNKLNDDYARILKGHDVYAEKAKILPGKPVKPVEEEKAPEVEADDQAPIETPAPEEVNTDFSGENEPDAEVTVPDSENIPVKLYAHTKEALHEVDLPESVKEIRFGQNQFGAPASNHGDHIILDQAKVADHFRRKTFEKTKDGIAAIPAGLISNKKEFTKFVLNKEIAIRENPRVKEGEGAESKPDYLNRMAKIALDKMGKNTEYYENIKKGIKDKSENISPSNEEISDPKEIHKYVGAKTGTNLAGVQKLGIPKDLKVGQVLDVKLRREDLGKNRKDEAYEYALDVMHNGKRIGGIPYREAKYSDPVRKTEQSDGIVEAIDSGKEVKVIVGKVSRPKEGDKKTRTSVRLELFIGDEVPNIENIKYQKKNKEALASSDPQLEQYIRNRFQKMFPKVNVKLFNVWYNKGEEVLGAAIGNTVFINKDKAVQSTRFHEYAHLYWDALPDNDSIKLKLLKMFGDEEKAIQAIGEAGVKLAKKEGFENALQVFWRKVKAIFGFKDEKEAAEVMADRIWNNSDNLSDFNNNTTKYMKDSLSLESDITSATDFLRAHGIDNISQLTEKKLEEIIKIKDKAVLSEQSILSEEEFAEKLGLDGAPAEEEGNEIFYDAYKRYSEDYKIAQEIYKEDLDNLSSKKLEKLYTKANNLDINASYNLLDVIGQKLVVKNFSGLLQTEGINENDKSKLALRALKQYMERKVPKDFETPSTIAALGTSPKDITNDHAIVQLHYKTLATLTHKATKISTDFNNKFIELGNAIKKEGGDLSEMFFEFNKKRIPVIGKAYDSLSKNQKAFLELWSKVNTEHNLSDSVALPSSLMSKWRILQKYGVFKLIETNLKSEEKYDNISILVDGVKTTLAKEKSKIDLKQEQGLSNKYAAVKRLDKIDAIAKKQYATGFDSEGLPIFKVYENRKLSAETEKTSDPTLVNDDIMEVVTGATNEMVYRDFITPYLPTATWIQQYYSDARTPKMAKWLSLWNNKNLYGESPDSGIGKGGKAVVDALTQYTALRFLAFNPKGAFFNILAALTATYREKGLGAILTATKRLVLSPKKFAGVMKSEGVVKMEQVISESGANKYASAFGRFMFITTELAETYNQGLVFIGLMTDTEWSMYDNKGNPKPGISYERKKQLFEDKENISGAYDPLLKRPIHYYPLGRALMQFKGWMPEIFLAHWRKEMIDSNGDIRKGIFNTLYENKFKALIGIFKNGNLNEWNKLSAVDKANYAKFGREMLTSFTLLTFMVANEGDEEDKIAVAVMRRALGDAAFLYNLDNAESLLSSPIPATSTLIDLKKFGEDLFMVNTFTRKVGNYEKGELRAKKSGAKLLPAQKIIRKVIFNEDYI